jgi:hypothetical protein
MYRLHRDDVYVESPLVYRPSPCIRGEGDERKESVDLSSWSPPLADEGYQGGEGFRLQLTAYNFRLFLTLAPGSFFDKICLQRFSIHLYCQLVTYRFPIKGGIGGIS